MNSVDSINTFVDTMLESKVQFENIKASLLPFTVDLMTR